MTRPQSRKNSIVCYDALRLPTFQQNELCWHLLGFTQNSAVHLKMSFNKNCKLSAIKKLNESFLSRLISYDSIRMLKLGDVAP